MAELLNMRWVLRLWGYWVVSILVEEAHCSRQKVGFRDFSGNFKMRRCTKHVKYGLRGVRARRGPLSVVPIPGRNLCTEKLLCLTTHL